MVSMKTLLRRSTLAMPAQRAVPLVLILQFAQVVRRITLWSQRNVHVKTHLLEDTGRTQQIHLRLARRVLKDAPRAQTTQHALIVRRITLWIRMIKNASV